MRTIAELPLKDFKVSLFAMNQKYIIKCEQGVLEQTYKIAESNVPDGVDGIFQLLDEAFIDSITARFSSMREDMNQAYGRYEIS